MRNAARQGRQALMASTLALLVACGGNGGSAPTPTPTPTPTPASPWPAPGSFGRVDLDRMAALAEIAANVQFFHPSDGVAQTDWDAFLQYAMLRSSQVSSEAEFLALLRSLFAPMAPDLRFNEPAAEFKVSAQDELNYWYHSGYVEGGINDPLDVYERLRKPLRGADLGSAPGLPPEAAARYKIAGIEVLHPLVQVVTQGKTLPTSQGFKPSLSWSPDQDFNKPAACLAAVAKTWGVIQNFFPYKESLQLNWPAELRPLLASCDPAQGADLVPAVNAQLRRSLTLLRDNHVNLRARSLERRRWFMPFAVQAVQGRPLLVEPLQALPGVQIYDEILAIDGVSPLDLARPLQALSLANQHTALEATLYSELMFTELPRSYNITVRRADGQQSTVQVAAINQQPSTPPNEADTDWHDIASKLPLLDPKADGTLYLNLSKLTQDDVPRAREALAQAKALVLDLRIYPVSFGAWFSLLGHLVDRPIHSLPLYHHRPFAPGPKVYRERVLQTIQPRSPYFKLPTVAIYSRFSQSQNEHALGFLQSAGVPLMGEPSSGANGNVTELRLLPDAQGKNPLATITFTGMEVTQHDGSRFMDVGILPDIQQGRSVAGVREQRDEVLEAALTWLRARR